MGYLQHDERIEYARRLQRVLKFGIAIAEKVRKATRGLLNSL